MLAVRLEANQEVAARVDAGQWHNLMVLRTPKWLQCILGLLIGFKLI